MNGWCEAKVWQVMHNGGSESKHFAWRNRKILPNVWRVMFDNQPNTYTLLATYRIRSALCFLSADDSVVVCLLLHISVEYIHLSLPAAEPERLASGRWSQSQATRNPIFYTFAFSISSYLNSYIHRLVPLYTPTTVTIDDVCTYMHTYSFARIFLYTHTYTAILSRAPSS